MKYLNLYNPHIHSLEKLLENQWAILRGKVQKVEIKKKNSKQKIKKKKSQKIKKRRRRVNNGRVNNK
jgi:hypothetical protein